MLSKMIHCCLKAPSNKLQSWLMREKLNDNKVLFDHNTTIYRYKEDNEESAIPALKLNLNSKGKQYLLQLQTLTRQTRFTIIELTVYNQHNELETG